MASIPINSVSPTPNPSSVKHAAKSQSFPQSRNFPTILQSVRLATTPGNGVFNLPKLSIFPKDHRHHSLKKSFKQIEDMVRKGYKPDASQVYRLLRDLHRCWKFNRSRFSETASLIQVLEDNCCLNTVVMYNIVIEQHCLYGDFKRVPLYVDRMIRRGIVPNFRTYSILLDGACRESGVDAAAMKLLDDVISEGVSPNLVSYNTLLAVLSKSNRVDDAIKFYREFPSLGLTPDAVTYNILVGTLCLEERWDEATEILAEMFDAGCLPDEDMYHSLISVLALHGRTDDALGLIEEMVRKGFDPTTTMYNPIITNLCKRRKVDDVVECLDEMRYSCCEPNDGTYNALAVLCEEGRMVKEAFSIICSLRDTENFDSDDDFYDCVLSALCTERNTYPAFHLLYEMTNHGFTPCSYTYTYLIRGLCAEGMENMALQITGIMEESGCEATSGNYNALLYSLFISGKIYSMLEVIITMIEKGCMPRETTYFLLLRSLANRKDKDLAVLVLKELYSRCLVGGDKARKLFRDYDLGDILEGSRKKKNGGKRKKKNGGKRKP